MGDGTAAALESLGLSVDFCAHSNNGADFARAFCTRHPGPGSVLLPGAQQRMGEPAADPAGGRVRRPRGRALPDRAVPPAQLPADPFGPRDLVFFCSPSAVRAFTAAWSVRPRCVAIGETTAAPARAAGFPTAVADKPRPGGHDPGRGPGRRRDCRRLNADPENADQETANQENAKQENES